MVANKYSNHMYFLSGHMRGKLSSHDYMLVTLSKSDFVFTLNALLNAKHGKRKKKKLRERGKNPKSNLRLSL